MIHIVNTIAPVFIVILAGALARRLGFLPDGVTGPLNRLVYYLAIPAMVFIALAKASFATQFSPLILAGTLIPLPLVFGAALLLGRALGTPRREMGTFIQSSCHGNLGYIGFAVAYYLLGDDGFVRATILAGFLMLLQNLFSVVALKAFSGDERRAHGIRSSITAVAGNPVILSTLAGMGYNLSGLPLPVVAERTLRIISGMALPLALLVIGASLSFSLIRARLKLVLLSAVFKLVVLPGAGLLLYKALGLAGTDYLPGFILLAAPSATVSYVMAVEMGGSPDQASAAVSMATLLSSVTYVIWLGILH
jgi:predicted permease